MFTIRLKIQRLFSKFLISRNNEKVLSSVREYSWFQVVKALLWKAIVLGFFATLILLPFYIMLVLALSSNEYLRNANGQHSVFWPNGLYFGNFRLAWVEGYAKALLGSFSMTIISVVFKIFFSMFFGYAFSIRKWRFKKIMWAFFISILILPDSALLLGQYRTIVILGWKSGSTYLLALSLPFVASVISGFMFRNAFEQIPQRVKEAAMVDGCSEIKYLIKVAMPMVSPTTWTVIILTAFSAWNALLWPILILAGTTEIQVINIWALDIGKQTGASADEQIQLDLATKMAGSILSIAPMFIAFFLFRKRIMGAIGRQGSAIKG